jgi:hypothetical protein
MGRSLHRLKMKKPAVTRVFSTIAHAGHPPAIRHWLNLYHKRLALQAPIFRTHRSGRRWWGWWSGCCRRRVAQAFLPVHPLKSQTRMSVAQWEREIDERVYRLYGLTAAEIKMVEEGAKR